MPKATTGQEEPSLWEACPLEVHHVLGSGEVKVPVTLAGKPVRGEFRACPGCKGKGHVPSLLGRQVDIFVSKLLGEVRQELGEMRQKLSNLEEQLPELAAEEWKDAVDDRLESLEKRKKRWWRPPEEGFPTTSVPRP